MGDRMGTFVRVHSYECFRTGAFVRAFVGPFIDAFVGAFVGSFVGVGGRVGSVGVGVFVGGASVGAFVGVLVSMPDDEG